ncbi:hypothetical protein C8R44DRAFT_732434 [Mycena epipterygia]|nr:hypothetical protein C8R44DRAFT_732434 [Mycena epipterygia]
MRALGLHPASSGAFAQFNTEGDRTNSFVRRHRIHGQLIRKTASSGGTYLIRSPTRLDNVQSAFSVDHLMLDSPGPLAALSIQAVKPNIVVVGGSYHVFAFPRLSVIPGLAHKPFVPYTNAFHASPSGSTAVVHGAASQILPDKVVLQSGESIPYEYLVMATGTGFLPLRSRTEAEGVALGQALQARVQESPNVVVIGGGAAGVQLATDAKEFYPTKTITLIHSREQLLNRFHPQLPSAVMEKLAAAGINVILGQRVNIPAAGYFPVQGPSYNVELADGRLIPADVAVYCFVFILRYTDR